MAAWSDWQRIICTAFTRLRPGGWLEMQEPECDIASDDAPIPSDNAFRQWFFDLTEASARADRPIDVIPHLKQMFINAGFVDVHEKVLKIPINGWPRGRRLKKIGKMWQQCLLDGLPGFSYALFNRWLGVSTDQIEVSLDCHIVLGYRETNLFATCRLVWYM